MIGKKMEQSLNDQIRYEMESSYLYLSMAAYFHAKSLDGMAQWMTFQAQEELGHAMRFFDHLVARSGRVDLQAIAAPKTSWASPLDAFRAAYEHEQFITGRIDELVALAASENDHAAGLMLQWFVNEQVEEEESVSKVVDMLELVGDSGHGLLMADRELGTRTAPAAADAAADTTSA